MGLQDDALRCIRCGLCSYTCPTYRVLRTQAQSPRGRLALIRAFGQGDPALGTSIADKIYRCTLCGACAHTCPGAIQVDDLLCQARQRLAGEGLLPPDLARLIQALSHSHNPSGEDNGQRLIWAGNLPRRPRGATRRRADVVYFVGCVASFFPRSYPVPQAMVKILDACDVEYALLGGDEWCCGFPLIASGASGASELRSTVQEVVEHNVEAVRATGATRVVFSCPSCYHTWKHQYPAWAGARMAGLDLVHTAEFLADLLAQKQPSLRPVEQLVTYHDPCDLGRKSGLVDAPRQVLSDVPGLTLIEMKECRENALCCGGGGNLEFVDRDLVQAAARRRLSQALETGAAAVVSACQQCERTLSTAAQRAKVSLNVVDITQILAKAIG